ncbi:MAG TPA: PsbP-related protein [Bacteroidia bacterium]|nr:PsbP-related protein [Bacteroidia bacterium]
MKKAFTLFTVLALASCGQMNTKEDDSKKLPTMTASASTKDWKTLDQGGYSIQYPSNWELISAPQSPLLFQIAGPTVSDTDASRPSINLVTEDLTGKNIDLDTYAKASLDEIKSAYKDAKMIENKKMTVGSTTYFKFLYTATISNTSAELEQWFRIDKEKAYVLSYITTPARYNEFKETSESMFTTFTVKN